MEKMIAYCGLDCAKCDAYIATQNNDQELLEKTAKKWSEWNKVEIRPEDLLCDGCTQNGRKFAYCAYMCEIKKCAEAKSFAHCGYCSNLDSCEKIRPIIDSDEQIKNNLKV